MKMNCHTPIINVHGKKEKIRYTSEHLTAVIMKIHPEFSTENPHCARIMQSEV